MKPIRLSGHSSATAIPRCQLWNGKSYATKQVRPIFVEESIEIVVVTVYVYNFCLAMKITYDKEVDALYIRFTENHCHDQASARRHSCRL